MMVRLSQERGEQLKSFARARGLSLVEAVGDLLRKAGAADTVPGFAIAPHDTFGSGSITTERYKFTFGGVSIIFDTLALGNLSFFIKSLIAQPGMGGKHITPNNATGELIIYRGKGNSLILRANDEGRSVERTLSFDLALDLARQIENAIR